MSSLGRSGPRNLILTPDRAEKRMSLAQMMQDQQFELESEMETLRQLDEAGRGRPTAVDGEREVRRGQADEAGNPYAKLYAEILKSPVEVDDAPALSAAHPFPHSLNPSAATEPTCPPPSGPLPTPPRSAASATGSLFPPTSLETVAEALDEPSTCSYIDLEELDFDETTMHTAVEWETGVAIDDTMHPYTVNHGSQPLQTRRSSETVSLEGTAQTHLFGATPAHFASCATLSSVNSAQDAVVQQRSSVIIEHANRPAIVSRFTETGLDASEECLRDEHQPAQYQPRVLARAVSEGALQHNTSAKPALVPYAPLFVTPARSSLSSTGRHTNTGNSVTAGRARKPLSSRPSLWFLKPSPSLPSISKGQSASKGSGVKLSRTKRGSASSTSASANTARSGSTSVSVRELGISAPLTDSARHVATGALNPHPNRESPFGRRAESPVEGYVTAAAAPSLPSRLAAGTPFMSAISEASSSQDYSSPFIAFTSPALSSTSSHSHSHSESAGPLTPTQHTWNPFDGSYPMPPQPDHLGKLQAEASALSEHASGQDFWAVDFAEAEAAEGDFIARHWESMHHRRTGLASSQQYRTSGSVSRTAGKLAVSQEERERRRQSQTVWRSRSRASNRSASMLSP